MRKIAWVLALVVALGTLSAGIAIAANRTAVTPAPGSETESGTESGTENEAADTEESLTGSNADKAAQAALAEVGGGEVLEVEAADGGDAKAVYEVGIRRTDGSVVEVLLDAEFNVISVSNGD